MPKPNMDDLLNKWAEAERDGELGRDCPDLPVLLSHVTEGRDLAEHSDHVTACPRCQKRLSLIRAELGRPVLSEGAERVPGGTGGLPASVSHVGSAVRTERGCPILSKGGGRTITDGDRSLDGVAYPRLRGHVSDRRRLIPIFGTVAAMAASIALVFVLWPDPTSDPDVAVFAAFAYSWPDDAPVRGEGTSPSHPGDATRGMPDWVARVLSDEQVQAAIDNQEGDLGMIAYELQAGRLMFDQDRSLIIAPHIDKDSVLGQRLDVLVTRDRQATERIVEALIRLMPEIAENNRPAIRRTLNRWRAVEMFGSWENDVEE